MASYDQLTALLQKLSIDMITHSHAPVDTNQAWSETLTKTAPSLPDKYALTKSLLLKGKKGNPVFLVALDSTQLNMKELAKHLNAKEFRMADEDTIKSTFKVVSKFDGRSFCLFNCLFK